MGEVPNSLSARITSLDGLRAFAILLVLVGHGWSTLPIPSDLEWLGPYLGNGALGVRVFFVISGYLITYLLVKEWGRSATINLRTFYARRMLRIFPAFYSYLFVLLLLRAYGMIDTTFGDISAAATFSYNYKHLMPISTNEDCWFVGHFWTLSLEEQFYLFWPVTVLWIGVSRSARLALLIICLSPLVRFGTYFIWPSARGQLLMMLHTATDQIMFGCLGALWQGHPRLEFVMQRFTRWQWPLVAAIFVLICSPWLGGRFRGAYQITIGLTLESFFITFIVLWIIRHPTSACGKVLSSKVLTHFGVVSFSVYLWQQLFLARSHSFVDGFPFNFLACFAVAEASYWFVEQPFLRLRRYFPQG